MQNQIEDKIPKQIITENGSFPRGAQQIVFEMHQDIIFKIQRSKIPFAVSFLKDWIQLLVSCHVSVQSYIAISSCIDVALLPIW